MFNFANRPPLTAIPASDMNTGACCGESKLALSLALWTLRRNYSLPGHKLSPFLLTPCRTKPIADVVLHDAENGFIRDRLGAVVAIKNRIVRLAV